MNELIRLLAIIWWVHGIAVAKGFWMTVFCFVMPPVAWVVSMMEILK